MVTVCMAEKNDGGKPFTPKSMSEFSFARPRAWEPKRYTSVQPAFLRMFAAMESFVAVISLFNITCFAVISKSCCLSLDNSLFVAFAYRA